MMDRRGRNGWTPGPARSPATALAAAVAVALGGAWSLHAQEWEPQIPEGTGTYPTGSLLVTDLDSVWTAAGDVLAGADILVVDGIIREIGADLEAPTDVRVVDGAGMQAIPGLVDEHSHTALVGGNESTAPVVAEVRVMDALDPDDFGLYRALSGGITTARIMHGSSNPVGGQSAVIKTRWGMEDAHDLLVPGAPRFVKFALGENVTRKSRGFEADARFPHSRQGVEAIYRQAFTAARAYREAWQRYEDDPDAVRMPPRRDLRMEALVDILEGRIQIHAHSYRADEILMLMRIAEEFGFRIDAFTHVLEGYKVASEMADHGAAGSTFSDWWQYKLEAYDAIPYNAAIMHDHGVLTSLNSDIPWLQSFMVHEIAKPVKYGGVSREDALRMLTLYPARIMDVDDRIGSLEPGKQGDLVLLSGSPFDAFTRVEKTVVDGIVYYDLSAEEETRGEPIVTQEEPVASSAGAPRAPGALAGAGGAPPGGARADGAPGAGPRGAVGRGAASTAGLRGGAVDGAGPAGGPAGARGTDRPAPLAATSQEQVVALVGGTVHPVSRAPIADGVVVFRGGVIEAVGHADQVDVPASARRVDVGGGHVYPGMIDAVSPLGIVEFGSVPQATDELEVGEYNPHVRAVAAVVPEFPQLGVARQNGMTAVGVAQSTGIIQGTMGVVALSDADTWERAAIRTEGPLVVELPTPREPDDESREPTLEGPDAGDLEEVVRVFERARRYAEAPAVADDPTRRFEANVWGGDRVFLEAMLPAVRGEVPVFFRADSDWEIRHVLRFGERFPGIRPVVVGGTEAFRLADELARRDVPVVLTLDAAYRPTPDRDESVTASYRNAGALAAAGVTVGFASDDAEHARNIPYMAAWSVAFGLPEEEAVRALTLSNAEILGLDDVMGSLDAGKRADVLVTDGSPLQFLTTIHHMFVGGMEVDPMDNKHVRLWEEYRTRR